MVDDKERARAVELALSQIEKQFGKGSIMKLGGDKSLYDNVPVYSTGSLSLDIALGIGGLPRGLFVSRVVAPVVTKMERCGDVGQIEAESGCPRQPGSPRPSDEP